MSVTHHSDEKTKSLYDENLIVFKCINCREYSTRPRHFGPGLFCEDLCRIEWESKRFGYKFNRKRYENKRYSKKRKKLMSQGDKIDRIDLFDYYDWNCHICNNEIDKTLRRPHPLAATIDHKIPLSLGGLHSWDNVAPAHLRCNELKGSSYIDITA